MSEPAQRVAFLIRVFDFESDYPAVIALWASAGPGVRVGRSDSPEEIQKLQAHDPDLFLVAVGQQGEVLGSVIGGFDGRRGLIYHLAVAPALRRQGIAAALMAEVEERLRARGCLKAYLLVMRGNASALAFYEQHGWNEMNLHLLGKELA